MKKYDYVKYFNKDFVQDIVIRLINEGFSDSYTAYIIGCEMESVTDFKEMKKSEGYLFRKGAYKDRLRINNENGHKSIAMKNKTDSSKYYFSGRELIVRALPYEEYIKKDKRKTRDIRKERMAKAKKTIEKLKKKRKKNKLL